MSLGQFFAKSSENLGLFSPILNISNSPVCCFTITEQNRSTKFAHEECRKLLFGGTMS